MTALILPFRGRPAKPRDPEEQLQQSRPSRTLDPANLPDTPQPNFRRGEPAWHHGMPVVVKGEWRCFCRRMDIICSCNPQQANECGRRGGL